MNEPDAITEAFTGQLKLTRLMVGVARLMALSSHRWFAARVSLC